MDLFEYAKSKTLDQESPLASRLRPRTLDVVVGQQHIVGKDKLLYRAIKRLHLSAAGRTDHSITRNFGTTKYCILYRHGIFIYNGIAIFHSLRLSLISLGNLIQFP